MHYDLLRSLTTALQSNWTDGTRRKNNNWKQGEVERKIEEAETSRPIVDSDVEEQANEQATEKVIEQAIGHDELGNDDDDMQQRKQRPILHIDEEVEKTLRGL